MDSDPELETLLRPVPRRLATDIMINNLTVSYPGHPKRTGIHYESKSGIMTLDKTIGRTGIHHMSLDINVMNDGAAPESTPVICSCGHHLVTLGALCKMWAESPPDGSWNMPPKSFECQCGVRYSIRGFDYVA